ncbi:uncharacterized protein LOC144877134 [Branchiostoma floridae x Branchiostoma japonicum]
MEEETDGPSEDDDINRVLSLGSTSQTLQVTYLIISLVLSVGCGLLLIFVVWKKRYLHKPSHYLRCNLAVDDIIFTSCLIPIRIHALLQEDVGGEHLWCTARLLVGPPCVTSMAGTYLMMATDLYHFVCNPLHYHDKVTTKRVVAGILATRAYSLFLGISSVAFGGKNTLSCEWEPVNSVSFTSILRSINFLVCTVATLFIAMLYCLVFKEARRQQERDENRNLWVFQTKAFKLMAPQAIVLTVAIVTVCFQIAVGRALISKENVSQNALIIADHVSILLYLTVSSMANPIIYSFQLPEFRQAFKELCGLPTNTPPAEPAQRNRDMEMATITGPGQDAPASDLTPAVPARRHRDMEIATITGPGQDASVSELTPAQTPVESLMPPPKNAPSDQARKQTTTADMSPGLAPFAGRHGHKTASKGPFKMTVRAEVHAEQTPRSREVIMETLPGQLHLDEESSDVPTSVLDAETNEATGSHGHKTASGRPLKITVQAEVHAEPTPRCSEDISQTLPGQLHLDEESSDVPTSMLDTKTDEATVGHTLDALALENPPWRPKIAWQEDTRQRRKSQP